MAGRRINMLEGKHIAVVMPAYNAEKTLARTLAELPANQVDEVILVDDASRDNTAELAQKLGIRVVRHVHNLGYGGNQKTCYAAALASDADIIIMVHPDYQYAPRLVSAMAWMLLSGEYDFILASRILGKGALKGGMPYWKYVANRTLTAIQNMMMGIKLSEYHTGYRAYLREALEKLPLEENSNDFVFDNQIIAQAAYFDLRIGEISCPTRYLPEASSINLRRSIIYGFGVLGTSLRYRLHRWHIIRDPLFNCNGRKLSSQRLLDRELIVSDNELLVAIKR